MKVVTLLIFSIGFRLVHSQSFIRAISAYPQLSNFTDLMTNNPTFAESLLNTSVSNGEQTVLVPSNEAFNKYKQTTGHSIQSLGRDKMEKLLQYHTLNASLTSAVLAKEQNMVVLTQVVDTEYKKRGGGDKTKINTNWQRR